MIRARIRYVFKNFNKKMTIYDYIQEPDYVIKKGIICEVKYAARPVFNSIKIGEDKKTANSLRGYQKYKMKHSKNRTGHIEIMKKNREHEQQQTMNKTIEEI